MSNVIPTAKTVWKCVSNNVDYEVIGIGQGAGASRPNSYVVYHDPAKPGSMFVRLLSEWELNFVELKRGYSYELLARERSANVCGND